MANPILLLSDVEQCNCQLATIANSYKTNADVYTIYIIVILLSEFHWPSGRALYWSRFGEASSQPIEIDHFGSYKMFSICLTLLAKF